MGVLLTLLGILLYFKVLWLVAFFIVVSIAAGAAADEGAGPSHLIGIIILIALLWFISGNMSYV